MKKNYQEWGSARRDNGVSDSPLNKSHGIFLNAYDYYESGVHSIH